jgi:phosphoenolpyruvate synthase/pyruvate phosphate dikinase
MMSDREEFLKATREGDVQKVEELLSKGVDPNVKDENGHARPETVWSSSKAETKPAEVKAARLAVAKVIVKGLPASPGVAYGKAKVCLTLEDAKRLMRMGDILVTKMTDPDWVPSMRLASAIVTDEGGITAHAAIVSRELGIPCIVETRVATMVMKTGEYYTVDARAGIVYEDYVEDLLGRKEELVALLLLRVSLALSAQGSALASGAGFMLGFVALALLP